MKRSVATETMALSLPGLSGRIDQEVRSGEQAYLLGRPCSYILYNYARYLGERSVRFFLNGLVAALVALRDWHRLPGSETLRKWKSAGHAELR